jgi:uncharacterized protein YciI
MIAVLFLRGDSWDPGRTLDEQVGLAGHVAWVRENRDRDGGAVIEAGPFHDPGDRIDDDLVGLALLELDSLEEARALVELDPVVRTRAFTYRLYEWGGDVLRR